MTFHPGGAPPPAGCRTARLVLRPLRAADAAADHEAVVSSAALLRRWSQSEWPADGFTLAENREDLLRHEREHEAGEAFTYTALDPEGRRCLGCVYLQPLREEEAAWAAGARHPVRVAFWVRASEVPAELDRHLLGALREWLQREWRFDRVVFSAGAADDRQPALLAQAGLTPLGEVTLKDGRRLRGFLAG